ncbi:MBOAT family O-acyltransferase [Mangrovivirga cuniculi]|uniref:Membrane-bound O-acyltransferase family protein n=1 Tax=Mangrovivirga cuniculi TaxID=2715131 RepID=A0A4D7JK98_9BACT|nr:MBOAT family O-acyltransferase [Mangrovivirga cuniculi]QCK13890.1 membrane-bound O-acyltransferase family protein [Mangrovivirga cuniculi]
MLFNSLHFALFFPLVVAIFFLIKPRFRQVLLLVASYYFYMSWKAEYIILILLSTFIDYFVAKGIEGSTDQSRRKFLLTISVLSNLGILFFFKYFNFFSSNVQDVINVFNINYEVPLLQVLLPVGISFYTFQTMSYTIDVYRKQQSAEKNIFTFALYVSYFPQLVAGPIERPRQLLPQLKSKTTFDYSRVTSGSRLMAWGFFKKLVIADRAAMIVNEIFNNPNDYHGWYVIFGSVLFAYQIYCDFSGYSDIAIGTARILGVELMKNFERPYFSKSISEFWKRWHISLSTWFRDYVYIPLGGNRASRPRWYMNLFITFLVSGFWHGANWTFIVWGALHGFYLIFAILYEKPKNRINEKIGLNKVPWLYNKIQLFSTFILVLIGWVFFRANNISEAIVLFSNSIEINASQLSFDLLDASGNQLIASVAFIFILEIIQNLQGNKEIEDWMTFKGKPIRWAFYILLIATILNFGIFTSNDFIYFQF